MYKFRFNESIGQIIVFLIILEQKKSGTYNTPDDLMDDFEWC